MKSTKKPQTKINKEPIQIFKYMILCIVYWENVLLNNFVMVIRFVVIIIYFKIKLIQSVSRILTNQIQHYLLVSRIRLFKIKFFVLNISKQKNKVAKILQI